MELTRFTEVQLMYIQDQIKFADTKAGFIAAAGGAIIQFALTVVGRVKASLGAMFLVRLDLYAALLLCVVGVVVAFWAIIPRTNWRHEKGVVFWGNVAEFASHKEYSAQLFRMHEHDLHVSLTEQIFFLAKTAVRKYTLTHRGFVLIGVSALLLILGEIGVIVKP